MNASDYDGRTALHLASSDGHLDCVRFLVDVCKVNPNVKDRWGNSPLCDAKLFSRPQVERLLEKHKSTCTNAVEETTERMKKL